MSKRIRINNVPDTRPGALQSGCVKHEFERVPERPSMKEWLQRTREAKPIKTRRTAAEVIRVMRDER